MAWLTRIVYIDEETGEVLDRKELEKRNFKVNKSQTIYHKLTETHSEKIIIYQCGPDPQQRLTL